MKHRTVGAEYSELKHQGTPGTEDGAQQQPWVATHLDSREAGQNLLIPQSTFVVREIWAEIDPLGQVWAWRRMRRVGVRKANNQCESKRAAREPNGDDQRDDAQKSAARGMREGRSDTISVGQQKLHG